MKITIMSLPGICNFTNRIWNPCISKVHPYWDVYQK